MIRAALLIAWILFIVACSSTPSSQSPPDEAIDDEVMEAGEMIFDGEQCTYYGQSELPPGIYSFVLKDLSDQEIDFAVETYLDGRTYQDYLDRIGDGMTHLPEVEWIDVPPSKGAYEMRSDGGKVYTYILAKEGNYGLVSWAYHPWHIWPCGQIWVLDSSSSSE